MTPNHPIPPARVRAEAERVEPFTLADAGRYAKRNGTTFEQDIVDAVNDDRERRLVDVSAVQREAEDRVTKHYDGVVLEREREAARKAWDAAMELARNSDRVLNGFRVVEVGDLWVERDRYLAREYPAPAPAPRECVLSDGSVVTYNRLSGRMTRKNVDGFDGSCDGLHWWPGLLNRPTDTGADFDALKQFAERAK